MHRASWKFWNRIPAPPKRRVRLGIDYGSCFSKIVFRDCDASDGENAILVLRNGSARIPSRVCVIGTNLLFGDDTKTAANSEVHEKIKDRVATEVITNRNSSEILTTKLSDRIPARDLAALTVWFLISEGHRAIANHFNGSIEDVEIGMTMGVPKTFFDDEQVRTAFLAIARRAWSLYCQGGLLGASLSVENARQILEKHPGCTSTVSAGNIQDWIRCEGEASVWWVLNSPTVGVGTYGKVDVGAGTTHANLFRIFGKVQTPKRSSVLYGAAAVTVGMDALHRAVADCEVVPNTTSVPERFEGSAFQASAKIQEALIPVCEQIHDSCRKAWRDAYAKLSSLELSAWEHCKMFVIGGGSHIPLLVEAVRIHPDERTPLEVMTLEQPADLFGADDNKIRSEDLPFVAVAYGLSKRENLLPNPYCREPG